MTRSPLTSLSVFAMALNVLLLPGCGDTVETADRRESVVHKVRVENKSSGVVHSVVVTGLGSPIAFSPISHGSRSSLAPSDGVVARPIYVRWTGPDDREQHMKFNLRQKLGERFRGTLVLTIRRSGLEISES